MGRLRGVAADLELTRRRGRALGGWIAHDWPVGMCYPDGAQPTTGGDKRSSAMGLLEQRKNHSRRGYQPTSYAPRHSSRLDCSLRHQLLDRCRCLDAHSCPTSTLRTASGTVTGTVTCA